MPKRRQTRVVTLMVAFLALPLSVTAGPTNELERPAYRSILNASLPIERAVGRYVAYRYSHAPVPGDLEYSFIIGFARKENGLGLDDSLSAETRVAIDSSLYEQISALRHKNPHDTLDSLRNKLKVRYTRVTEMECPAVRVQFEKFKKVQFGPLYDDRISIDPPGHEFRIETFQGWMNVTILDDQNPLVIWAIETRTNLGACMSGPAVPSARKK